MTFWSHIIPGVDDGVFRALADPSRRHLLDRLFERDGQTLTELEQSLPAMSRFGVMKHLAVLGEAGLVTTRRVGREKHHYLNPIPIQQIHERWLDRFRARGAQALLDLKATLEESPMETTRTAPPPAHVATVYIHATPDAIWQAITQPEFTRRYYYDCAVESDWRPGSPYRYHVDGTAHIVGELIEVDPPRRLVMTFRAIWDEAVAADPPTRTTFEIEPTGPDVCRLTVVHDGFEAPTATYEQTSPGWSYILSNLKTLLETGAPLPSESVAMPA